MCVTSACVLGLTAYASTGSGIAGTRKRVLAAALSVMFCARRPRPRLYI